MQVRQTREVLFGELYSFVECDALREINVVEVEISGQRRRAEDPAAVDLVRLIGGLLEGPQQERPRSFERFYWSPSRASRTSVTASGNTCAITERSCSVC